MRPMLRGLLALLLTLGVAACSDGGGDGEEAAEESTTTTTVVPTTIPPLEPDEIDTEASPFCATWAEIRGAGAAELTGDPETDTANRKDHYGKLVPLAERLVEQAAPEIKAAAEFALGQVREVAETGSEAPFTGEEAAERQQELAGYAQEHCRKG